MLLSQRRIALLPTMLLSGLMIGGALPAASAAPAPQVPAAPTAQVNQEIQAAAALSGKRDIKVTLIGVQLSDTANSQFQRINLDYYKNAFNSQADSFWGWTTVNRTNVAVTRTIPGFYSKSAHTGQTYVQMKDAVLRDLNYTPSANEVVVLAVSDTNLRNVDYSRGVEGGGFVYGNNNGVIILPIQNTLTNSVSTHELGHVFGLMHANSLECGSGAVDSTFNRNTGRFNDTSCYSKEYGDSLDVMGLSHQTAPQISASVWDAAGYGDGSEIRNAGTPGRASTYKLTPWSQGGANRAVKFTDPVSKEVYYLELRSPYGTDSTYAVNGNQGVKVTRDDPAQSWTSSMVLRPGYSAGAYYDPNHTWQAGETFTTTGGTKVRVDALSYGAATVTVTPKTIVNTATPSSPAPAPAPAGPANPWIKSDADLMGVKNDKLVNHQASGSGSVGAPQIIGNSGWNPALKTINTDWNADGIQDVVSNWKDGTLRVHYGKRAGGLEPGKVIGKSGWNTMNIEADVLVAGQKYPSLIARASDGKIYRYSHSTSDVGSRTLMTSAKGYLTDLFIADVNRDGKADVVGRAGSYLEAYLGDGKGGVDWGKKVVVGSGFADSKSITALTGFKGGATVAGLSVKNSKGEVKYYPLGSNNRYDNGGTSTYGYNFQDFRISE